MVPTGCVGDSQVGEYSNWLSPPPLLYSVYRASTPQQIAGPPATELIGPFHDILQGTNGLYTALPHYDYTTGMGSLDIARLYAAIGH